MNRLIKLII